MPPSFYEPDRVGQLFAPRTSEVVEAGRAAAFRPSISDRLRIILLLVDAQVDFIHEDGALSVPGAVADTRRTIDWMFANAHQLTTVAASLDSHVPIQIFSPTWWADADSRHPEPYTTITIEDVQSGRWRALYEGSWSLSYVQKLNEQAKKALMIWPYHTLIGTPGHNLTPALYEVIAYHSAARQSQPVFLNKGSIPKTEHYSILEPEVKVPDVPLGDLNTTFLNMLKQYDLVYVAGQAKSHCVYETVSSIVRFFERTSDALNKIRILTDCTSSVVHPTLNFDKMADEEFAGLAARGLQLVKSTDPVG